jgi:hypothetical protein
MLQVTAVLLSPVTAAVNCCVCPPVRLIVDGETVTDTGGLNVTVAVPALDGSAALVAVTVTGVWAVTVAGAV